MKVSTVNRRKEFSRGADRGPRAPPMRLNPMHILLYPRVWTAEKLDGQGKARREAARRRNSECKINSNSRNSSRSNGSRPTAVQRAVIGRRRGALVAARVRRRVNMSVINTGGGVHWTGGRCGAPHTSCYLWAGPYVQTAKFWREKWDIFQSRI